MISALTPFSTAFLEHTRRAFSSKVFTNTGEGLRDLRIQAIVHELYVILVMLSPFGPGQFNATADRNYQGLFFRGLQESG